MKPPAYNNEGEVQQISQEQGERNVANAICVQLAGRAIIRVVSRCEEAQDNCNLGKIIGTFFPAIIQRALHFSQTDSHRPTN